MVLLPDTELEIQRSSFSPEKRKPLETFCALITGSVPAWSYLTKNAILDPLLGKTLRNLRKQWCVLPGASQSSVGVM